MNNILIEKKYILEYIKDTLNDLIIGQTTVNNCKYHHNTNYEDAASICQYGILSLEDLNRLGIKKFGDNLLHIMSDMESHVNGNKGISLSVVGLTDLYPNEDVYDPYKPTQVDFLVSSDIQAYRTSIHYGNEYLSYNSITNDKLRAIDIRLLKLIELLEKETISSDSSIQSIVKNYNCLRDIAIAINQKKLEIPIREMSDNCNFTLDIDKMSLAKKLVLK